ncbi:LysR substrate-binding domain-containing protein [Plastoroseomonas hellenica]|uniref:LysR substrate-binding domain-containing protein n=1 Tax=Plastoroseomonas hellenica TaxID=2687306 RepID=UPI001BA57A4C|nr:LysR substrate-binding domain-containing protein [Plastoroseomonas hellenica]MBR0644932.1 LysR family transcriptional regulator [Plastoroseomonas hellenica]
MAQWRRARRELAGIMVGSRLPLRGIAIFEAAARLGSFRAAAAELRLTPSAVSHQIRLLELILGVSLFVREGRGVSLSADGVDYARSVRPLFQRLRKATHDIARRSGRAETNNLVKIHTPPSLASRWLLPRLPRFLSDFPGIDIRVNSDPSLSDEADVVIAFGDAERWQHQARLFLLETTQPLCAPALLAGGQIRKPGDLVLLPLISTRVTSLSWDDWFQRQKVELDQAALKPIQFNPSHLAIDAAVNGLGVILESDILTREDLASGRLVTPFPGSGVVAASYWLLPLKETRAPSAVETVYQWLLDQAASERPGGDA